MLQKDIINKAESIAFIKENWELLSNKEMAEHLGVCIQYVRDAAYKQGLYRMRLEYWTEAEVKFLIKKYHTVGDLELSEIFQKKWPKNKKWTIKHIEKKRKYLNLKRTPAELQKIRARNKKRGSWWNMGTWKTRGAAPDGGVKIWNHSYNAPAGSGKFKVIKVKGKWVHFAHWLYIKTYGPFPTGHVVGFKDGDNMNVVPENLEAITRAELSRRNGKKRIPVELKELQKTLDLLNQTIKQKAT